ncbi:hypothetical protein VaNZ11_000960, partial [Volvox africanus]
DDNGGGSVGDDGDDGGGRRGQRAKGEEKEELEVDFYKLPILERRCPSKFRFGHGSGARVRLTDRKRGEPYAIKEAEINPALAAEIREFESFSLYGSFAGAQHGEPLRRTTYQGYLQSIRQALGWLHRVEGVALGELRLGLLVPGTQRAAARKVHAFLLWQERDRGMCKRSTARSLAALIQVTKFLYHEQSQVREGDKPYSDLDVIKSLRAMSTSYERANRVAGHVVDSSIKWMDWPVYLEYVGELRKECAACKANGRPRNPADVAMSLQAFLIAAILSCVPDRQRTLRELVIGRTLAKDRSGIWSIRHTHADYKTGGTYGERPPLVIDPGIYYELEEFISTWRSHLNPQHNFLFSKRDGSGPLTAQELSRSFSLNAFRLTGRKLNPHMVRDMVVTYARSGHATEHELEGSCRHVLCLPSAARQFQALAIYMGHSLAEQRGTYDRRTKAEKVQPAMGLLAKISGSAATVGVSSAVTGGAGGIGSLVGMVDAGTPQATGLRGGVGLIQRGSEAATRQALVVIGAPGPLAPSSLPPPSSGAASVPQPPKRATRAVKTSGWSATATISTAATVASSVVTENGNSVSTVDMNAVKPGTTMAAVAAAAVVPGTVTVGDSCQADGGGVTPHAPGKRGRARRKA